MTLDLAIIVSYLILMNIVGIKVSSAGTARDYFLSSKRIPWPISSLSIVATETSSLTFISIPGLAYATGTGFIQVVFGYLIGRILVAYILLPKYFEGNMETTYEFLQSKFKPSTRKITAVIFQATRLLAEGVRLFATAIPLALLTGWDYKTSILLIGASTLIYTIYGGLKSVAIVDTIQFVVYILSAIVGIYFISSSTGYNLSEIISRIPSDKWIFFSTGDSAGGIFGSYNIISGIIGGALLSFGSHGTDHLMVQRLLACSSLNSARKAIISSGVIVIFQIFLFMFWGLSVYVLFSGKTFGRSDEILPYFIINYLPDGARGMMLAGIFAATMSTLSATINSLSSSTAFDLLEIDKRTDDEKRRVLYSRLISIAWTVALISAAMLFKQSKGALVELGLGIASVTYGGMIGIFLFGRFSKKFSDRAAVAGALISMASVLAISFSMNIFWPWYVPIGLAISFISSMLINTAIKSHTGNY